ncbi:hypothetical protein SE18_25695 [Herpetosiphon geysericola]|uniref:Uncharacterized protein n=1 Tax=Herpetosiphon geysericola TaxID=70996 RepID=A0A0P6Y4J1_9CHLR|nr:hypothetical protein SE18_25695 [Herpetosiphon geysericola]
MTGAWQTHRSRTGGGSRRLDKPKHDSGIKPNDGAIDGAIGHADIPRRATVKMVRSIGNRLVLIKRTQERCMLGITEGRKEALDGTDTVIGFTGLRHGQPPNNRGTRDAVHARDQHVFERVMVGHLASWEGVFMFFLYRDTMDCNFWHIQPKTSARRECYSIVVTQQ